MNSKWREHAAPIIAKVIAEVGTGDMTRLRKALRAAYPFGTYDHHPLKIWRDEIRAQLGLKRAKRAKVQAVVDDQAGQGNLFEAADAD